MAKIEDYFALKAKTIENNLNVFLGFDILKDFFNESPIPYSEGLQK